MSKEKLFELYLAKNPTLRGEKITFTQAGFRKFFNTTYDEAYKQGFNQEPDTDEEEFSAPHYSGSASVEELLGLFGMRR